MRLLIGTAATCLIIPIALVLVVATYPYVASPKIAARYGKIHDQAQAVELFDKNGRFGVIQPIVPAGQSGPKSVYLAVEDANPHWIRFLRAGEDERLGTFGSVNCLDLLAMSKAAALHLATRLAIVAKVDERGGSALCQQLSRSMRGLTPQGDSGGDQAWQRYSRKFTEARDGMVLAYAYGGISDPRYRALLASHMELVVGASGSRMGPPIRGVEMAARILWGKGQDQLTQAEAAILAASVRRPIMLAPDNLPGAIAERNDRWQYLQGRAGRIVDLIHGAGTPEAEKLNREIDAIPAPRPFLPQRLEALASGPRDRFQLATSPVRQARRLAGPELMTAIGELQDRLGKPVAAKVTAIRLTLDVRENQAWSEAVEAALAEAYRAAGVNRQAQDEIVDIAVVLAGPEGIARHFTNRGEMPFVNGSPAERGPEGRFELRRAQRQIGSLGKGVAALLLAQRFGLEARWCNRSVTGVANPGGDKGVANCSLPGAMKSPFESFQRSLNLPIIEALRSIPDAEIRRAAAEMNIHLPADVPARVALTLGLGTARPTDIMMLYSALARGEAQQPSLISEFRLGSRWQPMAPGRSLDLRSRFISAGARRFVRSVLNAPLRPGGTMASFGAVADRPLSLIGKTGTVSVGDRNLARYMTFASTERPETGLIFFAVRHSRSELGDVVRWSRFRTLLKLISASRKDLEPDPPRG